VAGTVAGVVVVRTGASCRYSPVAALVLVFQFPGMNLRFELGGLRLDGLYDQTKPQLERNEMGRQSCSLGLFC
jgi:hypothetical protein